MGSGPVLGVVLPLAPAIAHHVDRADGLGRGEADQENVNVLGAVGVGGVEAVAHQVDAVLTQRGRREDGNGRGLQGGLVTATVVV